MCQVDLPNGPWRPLTPASTSFAPNPLHPTTKTILQLHPRLSSNSLPSNTGQHLGQSAVSLGQGLVNFGETWSNLWSSTCIRFLTVAVDSTIHEKTVTEVGWLSRSRAMLQMTDSAGSTNSGPTSFLFGQNPEREHCRMLRQNSGLGIGKTRVGLW